MDAAEKDAADFSGRIRALHDIELTVANGRKLIVEARRESPKSAYIKSVTWNGATVKGLTVEHASLAQGGSLVFHLSDQPAKVA